MTSSKECQNEYGSILSKNTNWSKIHEWNSYSLFQQNHFRTTSSFTTPARALSLSSMITSPPECRTYDSFSEKLNTSETWYYVHKYVMGRNSEGLYTRGKLRSSHQFDILRLLKCWNAESSIHDSDRREESSSTEKSATDQEEGGLSLASSIWSHAAQSRSDSSRRDRRKLDERFWRGKLCYGGVDPSSADIRTEDQSAEKALSEEKKKKKNLRKETCAKRNQEKLPYLVILFRYRRVLQLLSQESSSWSLSYQIDSIAKVTSQTEAECKRRRCRERCRRDTKFFRKP